VKIAVYHNLPSGGAKRALHNYVRGLVAAGHEVDAYSSPQADEGFLDLRPLVRRYTAVPLAVAPTMLQGKVILHELAQYTMLRVGLERHARAVAAQIDGGGYDLAFVHHCRLTQSPWMLRHLSTPSVYYCQEPRRTSFEYSHRVHTTLSTRRGRALQRTHLFMFESLLKPRDIEAARSADMILANSAYSVENIKRAYGRYAAIAYLGLDLSLFRAGDRARERAVVSVGALHPAKGHELVIEAAGTIAADRRPVVHLVADRALEGQRATLAALAQGSGVAVEFHQAISDNALVERYGSVRATVCAAELEPFGFTPIESMACGTPVVAVREAGYRETVIDGVNGALVARDPRAMGAAIAQILDEEERWQRLREGALESGARWTLEAADARLAELFGEALAAR
jgi:glycosyltransferase involved in cell wall biosynthesis